jgi:DNA-binding transcriptional LysR family regulator
MTVSECGSFTLAAKRLEKTQSAVSQAIRQFEEELGVPLILRDSRPMALTPSGAILRERGQHLIEDAEALAVMARNVGQKKTHELRLGLVNSFAAVSEPTLIKCLLDSAVNLTVWSGLTSPLVDALMLRKLDMIVTNDFLEDVDGVERTILLREPYVILVPANIASDSAPVDLAAMARNYPMIRYNGKSAVAMQIERLLRYQHVRATRRLSVDTTSSVIATVAAGVGWAITTPLCILEGRSFLSGVRILPLPDMHFFRRLVLVSRHGEYEELHRRVAAEGTRILNDSVLPEIEQLMPWVKGQVTLADQA